MYNYKIALFSGIHANLAALEAILADIDQRNPDAYANMLIKAY